MVGACARGQVERIKILASESRPDTVTGGGDYYELLDVERSSSPSFTCARRLSLQPMNQ